MVFMTSFGDANSGLQAGTINGPVHAVFYAPPDRLETTPLPEALIPFSRDADFVERWAILDSVQQKCTAPDARVALVGLGGVGKSQLVIEFAYRTHAQSPETWVFWVHASNAVRFEQSFRDIADHVKIPGRQDPRANICKLVHNWLLDSTRRWMLVPDMVDDARFLLELPTHGPAQPADPIAGSKPLREYLPHCQNGSMLITTRNQEAALQLVEHRDVMPVDPMDETHALALFEAKLGRQEDRNEMAELVVSLEFMPLAIVQAAAYISQRVPRCSVRQYLEEFTKSDRKRTRLLNHDEGQLRRDWEAKNSILITWQISFDYIHQIRPSAADLLSLMSFFDRQGIPESLLRIRSEQDNAQSGQKPCNDDQIDDSDDNLSQSDAGADGFEDDVAILRNFNFVSVNVDGTTFETHALVQLATRKWLRAHGKHEQWNQQFIRSLCTEFPTGEHENWTTCQALFVHAKSAMIQPPEGESSLLEWATLLYHAAGYAWRKGSISDTENLAVKSMNSRRKILGHEHEDTLLSIEMVGLAHQLGGQWSAAEELFVQVMETRKTKLGANYPDTLNSIAYLALTYQDQGRWKEAEELEVQVIETSKRVLGEEHPDTLTSIANLASTFWNQGRWKEAEELHVQVIGIETRVLGKEHPDTLNSMANLASTIGDQGRWKEAEELEVQVIETRSRVLGEEHPATLTSMNALALTLRSQGRGAEALNLMEKCVQLRKRILGVDHPDTVSSSTTLMDWQQGGTL